MVTKRLYGKEWEWSIGQIKTCRKKQHVEIDDIKEMSDLICGKAAVGGNYNSTRDSKIHNFFNKCNVAFEVVDNDGNKHYPREWFTAPLSVIVEVIKLVVSRHIDEYEYNVELKLPVRKNVSYLESSERKAMMVAEERSSYGSKQLED